LKLSALYHDTHGDGAPDVDVLPGAGDLQQSSILDIGQYDRTIEAYSAVLKADLGRVDLTSITGYNVNRGFDTYDNTGRFGALSASLFNGVRDNALFFDSRATKFVQELRLAAPVTQSIDVLFGAFYTDENYEDYQIDQAITAAGAVAGELYTQSITGSDEDDSYEEYAAFVNVTFRMSEQLDLQVGARQSHSTADQAERLRTGPLFGVPPGQQSIAPALESTTDAFTYLVTPRFKLSPDLMLYARFASGYRPGLFNPNAGPGAPAIPSSFDSDTIKTYELGMKADLLERRLFIDASLYYIDWRDLQLQVVDPASNLGYKTNGGAAKSEGVELSVTVRPLTGLSIDAWVNYNNAVLTESFPAGSTVAGASGARLPFSSRYSGSVSIQQEFPLAAEWDGFVSGSASYVDDRLGNFRGATAVRQQFPSYTKLDLGAGLKHDLWTFNLFVNNVADKRGVLSYGFYPPFRATYIQPRTIGLEISRGF
jgi:iron complex outermembrane recepter protein